MQVQRRLKISQVLEILTYTAIKWLSFSECLVRVIELGKRNSEFVWIGSIFFSVNDCFSRDIYLIIIQ